MIRDYLKKQNLFHTVWVKFLTIGIAVLCFYDLYQLFKHIEIVMYGKLRQIIYSVFIVELWLVCWWSLFYGFLALDIYIAHRSLGTVSSEARHIMSYLCSISRMKPVISVGRHMLFYTGIIGILSFFIFSNWRFLFMPFLSIVVLFWLWIRISTPPVIIILSSSHPNCLKRHRTYKHIASPLRVVTLLDFTSVYAQKIQTDLHLDCLRATNDNDWWDEIAILLTLTPFIIIDTSNISDGVLREAQYVLSSSLTYKSIFLTDNQGKYPLLDKILVEQSFDIKKLFIANENRAIELVKRLITQKIFPKQNVPLTSIL